MMEEWLDMIGYEGLYQVSNLGEVRALPKPGYKKGGILKQSKDKHGYMRIRLSKNNQKSTVSIHRAVALAFIPNPENKSCVNHIDGNKSNNHVSNLEWVSYKENIEHADRTGLFDWDESLRKAVEAARFVERKNKKRIMRSDGVIYESIEDAAKSVNVDRSVISRVVNGVRGKKTAAGYGWSLVN